MMHDITRRRTPCAVDARSPMRDDRGEKYCAPCAPGHASHGSFFHTMDRTPPLVRFALRAAALVLGVTALFAQAPRVAPAAFTKLTDSLGFIWDVNSAGGITRGSIFGPHDSPSICNLCLHEYTPFPRSGLMRHP